jgi:hypothetical protein
VREDHIFRSVADVEQLGIGVRDALKEPENVLGVEILVYRGKAAVQIGLAAGGRLKLAHEFLAAVGISLGVIAVMHNAEATWKLLDDAVERSTVGAGLGALAAFVEAAEVRLAVERLGAAAEAFELNGNVAIVHEDTGTVLADALQDGDHAAEVADVENREL